jgi:hypothetical protein
VRLGASWNLMCFKSQSLLCTDLYIDHILGQMLLNTYCTITVGDNMW